MSNQITNHEEVLRTLDELGGAATAADVAEELIVSPSTARRYLNELVERGWASRGTTVGGFYRAVDVQCWDLTDRGRRAIIDNEGW